MSRISVMHITDTLTTGGMERMAVNLVNFLPRDRYLPYLCTTRQNGPLAGLLAQDVGWLRLGRRWRFDVGALRRLISFIRVHNIHILHAHNTSLFIAGVASLFPPYPALVFHENYGLPVEERQAWLYRSAALRISAVIGCNQEQAEWARRILRVPADRVWYIPNFVSVAELDGKPPALPGTGGGRVVCVANLRAQKDHYTLLRAMKLVVRQMPEAHLLLVGAPMELAYSELVRKEIVKQRLDQNVSMLGQRLDVPAILQASNIGVLSSASEGLPLALLEYGMASLPAVATNVGQCAEVLDGGRAGILVPSGSPDQLAQALLSLLRSPQRRSALGQRLRCRVQERYSPAPVVEQVCRVYEELLSSG